MRKTLGKIADYCRRDKVSFYASLVGPLSMGTVHLVSTIIKFDWILINYCIFFYVMAISKAWQWLIERYHLKPGHYGAGIISMLAILAPMMASFILTIMFKDAPHYFVDWFIYAYALYGTIKMVFAIKGLVKKDKTDRRFVLAHLGMIGALYTLQMMEFVLVMTFGSGSDQTMYLIQLFTQGAIFLFALVVIGLFAYRAIENRNKRTQ